MKRRYCFIHKSLRSYQPTARDIYLGAYHDSSYESGNPESTLKAYFNAPYHYGLRDSARSQPNQELPPDNRVDKIDRNQERRKMIRTFEIEVGGRMMSFETGRLAKQAGGAVTIRYGDLVLLATATASKEPRQGVDFLPLTVDVAKKHMRPARCRAGSSSEKVGLVRKRYWRRDCAIGRCVPCFPRITTMRRN